MPTQSKAYGTTNRTAPLAPTTIERRDPGLHDIAIKILFCGVCHTDLHTARGEWGNTIYPCVPGHEIVGQVTAIGPSVTRFKVGDTVGVGCMIDSCQHCAACAEGTEQYCENGFTDTYNGKEQQSKQNTYGGYSESIVVDEKFVLRVSHTDNLAAVAPLLCAGITTYSPLRHWNVGPGSRVGIVGLGGLGHMGVKIAKAMGAHVGVFTTSAGKRVDALRLGADEVVLSTDAQDMTKHARYFDFIINTVAVGHNLDAYVNTLRVNGTMVLVGIPGTPHTGPSVAPLVSARRSIGGSAIGGIAETQEMLDFCAKHNIVSDIEIIDVKSINEAYERMLKGDVKYRFVIDIATLGQKAS